MDLQNQLETWLLSKQFENYLRLINDEFLGSNIQNLCFLIISLQHIHWSFSESVFFYNNCVIVNPKNKQTYFTCQSLMWNEIVTLRLVIKMSNNASNLLDENLLKQMNWRNGNRALWISNAWNNNSNITTIINLTQFILRILLHQRDQSSNSSFESCIMNFQSLFTEVQLNDWSIRHVLRKIVPIIIYNSCVYNFRLI